MNKVRELPWCPGCREGKWSWEREDGVCDDCGMVLDEAWPWWGRLRYRLAQAVFYGFLGVWLLGPPALIGKRVLAGGPLVARETVTKTVTVTEYHGVLVDSGAVLIVWLLSIMVLYIAAIGPRRV